MTVASVAEAFSGLRIPLPGGKELVSTKPLLFPDACRWLELLGAFDRGTRPFEETLRVVFAEMPELLGIADMSVLDDMTFGEVVDHTVYRFLAQRRMLPAWVTRAPTSPPTSASS